MRKALFKNYWGSIGFWWACAKLDNYQCTVAPNCFKNHTNSWCHDFIQKKKFCLISGLKFTLSDVTLFLPNNLSGLKKLYSGLQMLKKDTNLDIHNIQKQPPEMSYVKGVLRNFQKTCRNTLVPESFF